MITFLALAHMLDAAQLVRGGWGGGMITFLALAHTLDATQLVGDDHIPCTCTHVAWMLRNWSGMIAFLALTHTLDATQLVGDDHISCTCTHVGCCATGQGWVGGGG